MDHPNTPAVQDQNDPRIALFDDELAEMTIRRVWHDGRWFFSVIDVIGLLTDAPKPRQYWFDMKRHIHDEGFVEVSSQIRQLKMPSADGKQRYTDAADTETMLRLVQSIPSPKAEPFKQWLARVGAERLSEIDNPALALDRVRKQYVKQGYSDDWIDKRLQGQIIRQGLTDEWQDRGAHEGKEFALLTDTLNKGTFDVSIEEHKAIKDLKPRHNLRDSMTPLELVLTSLSEETAKTLHQTNDSQGLGELQSDCGKAGRVAGDARRDIEELTGQPVVSNENYKTLRQERLRQLQPPLLDAPDEA